MQTISWRTFLRTLSLTLLVAGGLLVAGCDSGGANSEDGNENGDGDGEDTTAPTAPTGLSGEAKDGAVDLTWSADDASDQNGYNVYRATSSFSDVADANTVTDSPLSDTTYTDDGVSNGTTYYYRVTAVDDAENESELSDEVSKTPSDASSSGRIAFSKGPFQEENIYTMKPDGSDVKQITSSDAGDDNPAWSPDGSRLAFDRASGGGIYVINADGSDLQEVVTSGSEPAWAPDGSRIAFSKGPFGEENIYTVKPDGSDLQQVTDATVGDTEPAWSPDGDRIAFASERGDTENVYTISPDGSDVEQVTDNRGSAPDWSPDGARLAYLRSLSNIYTIKPDGSDIQRVHSSDSTDRSPTWSPNGSRIGFASQPRSDSDDDSEIFTINPDGSDLGQITDNSEEDRAPDWTP